MLFVYVVVIYNDLLDKQIPVCITKYSLRRAFVFVFFFETDTVVQYIMEQRSKYHGNVKICAVKKYPKFDFATSRTSITVTTINSFLEFCQGRRRRLF